jgi:hypothetical protein
MHVGILKSAVEAEMCRNVPQEENVINSNVGLQLLNILATSCGCYDGKQPTVLAVVCNAVKNL